jgi:hypothetical protein
VGKKNYYIFVVFKLSITIKTNVMNKLNNKEQIIFQAINDGGSATFATIIANVEQKMLKTGNPLRNAVVTKLVDYKFLLNAVYQNAVNNQRIREGKEADFKAQSNWHEKVYDSVNGAIVCNKNKRENTYLSGIVQSAENLKYFVDGIEATAEQIEIIKQFKQKSSAPNQKLENEITFRTIKIEGIKEVRANKNVITFKD